MNQELIKQANAEVIRGLLKWGHADRTPTDLLAAIQEETGEVAHTVNHNEETREDKAGDSRGRWCV